ncbi:MAG: polysaccharide biosynthesis/export family protein, partial [Candidatus Eremiobacterota bacterium]
MIYISKIIILLLCVFVLTFPAMAENASEGAFTLQPGDTIEITVVPFPDYSKSVIVREDFRISYPFISGAIDVRNLTTAQVKDIITAGLKKIIKKPLVNVEVTNFAKLEVYISGEIKTPGKYEVRRNARLMEALVTAGITEKSDLQKVSLVKGDKQFTVNIKKLLVGEEKDMSKNIRLDSRDIIYVPEINKKVTVTGFVKTPGSYIVSEKLHTVLEAVNAAGGLINMSIGSSGQGNIIRKLTLSRKGQNILTEDLNEIYKEGNNSANMELEDGDVIFVSEEKVKLLVSVAGQLEKPGIYEIQEGDRVL